MGMITECIFLNIYNSLVLESFLVNILYHLCFQIQDKLLLFPIFRQNQSQPCPVKMQQQPNNTMDKIAILPGQLIKRCNWSFSLSEESKGQYATWVRKEKYDSEFRGLGAIFLGQTVSWFSLWWGEKREISVDISQFSFHSGHTDCFLDSSLLERTRGCFRQFLITRLQKIKDNVKISMQF